MRFKSAAVQANFRPFLHIQPQIHLIGLQCRKVNQWERHVSTYMHHAQFSANHTLSFDLNEAITFMRSTLIWVDVGDHLRIFVHQKYQYSMFTTIDEVFHESMSSKQHAEFNFQNCRF